MNTINIRRAIMMIVATILIAIFIGIAFISAKEQVPDGSSEGRRMVSPVLQSPAPQLYFRKLENRK
jgi:hypothetical protein